MGGRAQGPGTQAPHGWPHLTGTLRVGDRIHISGHTTDLEQTVESMEVDHARVESAGPGDDVALAVTDHVREHDHIFREG